MNRLHLLRRKILPEVSFTTIHLRLNAIYISMGYFISTNHDAWKRHRRIKETHSMGKNKSILTMQTSIKHIQLSYSYKKLQSSHHQICHSLGFLPRSSVFRSNLGFLVFFWLPWVFSRVFSNSLSLSWVFSNCTEKYIHFSVFRVEVRNEQIWKRWLKKSSEIFGDDMEFFRENLGFLREK